MKVFVAEDQFLLRQGLVQLLTSHDVEIAGTAERLFITDKAVQKHINSIFTKLDLPDSGSNARRVQAVLTYLRQ